MSAYRALYRKWRPMRFDDVVGQNHISDTLRGSVKSGRIAHAYLFCGTRGTGKTSTAKIFSRAVNCESPIDGEPCNECPTCRGILDGSILDVFEMDAASNGGVDNIREIRDEVIYAPAGCRYKVYIVDEVHMLTDQAFNALLKTLEEPPRHVIFVLATTEPHKIPRTVLSRCQRFDFRRIGIDDIAKRIEYIAKTEGIEITPDAAELVAELGDGSMRDAISVLDRCAAFGDEQLTTDSISEIVGIISSRKLFEICDGVAENDTKGVLKISGEMLRAGGEPHTLLENLVEHFRTLLICKATDASMQMLEKTAFATEKYVKQAKSFSIERLMYCVKIVGEYLSQSKWMSNPKIAVEMAMIKLCSLSYSTDTEALLARIEKLESAIANMSSGTLVKEMPTKNESEEVAGENEKLPPWDIEEEPKLENEQHEVVETEANGNWEYWNDALSEIKKESETLYAFLYIAEAKLSGDNIEIEVGSQMTYDRIATPGGIEYMSRLFTRVGGRPLGVRVYIKGERPEPEEDKGKPSIVDLAAKKDVFGDKMDIIN